MENKIGAVAVASVLTFASLSAPAANGATVTYDRSTDTCTYRLSEDEFRANATLVPAGAYTRFVYEKVIGTSEDLAAASDALFAAYTAAKSDRENTLALLTFLALADDFSTMAADEGLLFNAVPAIEVDPSTGVNDSFHTTYPVASLVILAMEIERGEESKDLLTYEVDRMSAATKTPAAVEADYRNFDIAAATPDPQLQAELTSYMKDARSEGVNMAKKNMLLTEACLDRRSKEIDLLGPVPAETPTPTPKPTDPPKVIEINANEGSTDSNAAVAIGVVAALAAALGILAAALPMIKQYLPAQVQALLP